jgi:hypothetical protein
VGDVFCGMARSSDSKKSHQSNSDSDSEDEVHDELPFLREENERLDKLLDNRDDMLREAKKTRKELRASLQDARNRVVELETQNLDAKLEIDSLKASSMFSDEIDCRDFSVYLPDLTALNDKRASTCDELYLLRVEVAKLKSRPALLGSCTSCPVSHGKIYEMHAYTISLETTFKQPIPTSCSTCEVHAVKNLELAHYVDRLQDENHKFRKMMGWLSGHEPQLRMMIEAYKRYDGQVLGSEKVGECSGEGGEKIGDILAPPKTFHKKAYPLKNKLDTTPDLPYSLTPQMISENLSSSRVTWEMSLLGKRRRMSRSADLGRNRTRAELPVNPNRAGLHSPSARCLHSHSLGGYGGGL